MRILVTGGCGFIGSAVVRHMVANGDHEIVNVDKLTYAADPQAVESAAKSDRYRLLEMDICNRSGVDDLFDEFQPEAVIHLAAETHVDRSIEGSDDFIHSNIAGTHSLLESTRRYLGTSGERGRGHFRFLHISTDEVYGSLGDEGAFDEETRYSPNSPYAASKASSDHLVGAWGHTYNLPVIITNCSNNYGPWQHGEKLIPLAISRALAEQPIPVYGSGRNVRDWLFVEDHARALERVLAEGVPGRRYNIGGNAERANVDVVRGICDVLDEIHPSRAPHDRLIEFVSDRPGHDWRYAIDATRIRDELGWRPEENFESGLRRTVEWFVGKSANDNIAGERNG